MSDANRRWQSFHVKRVFDWDWDPKQRVQKVINFLIRVLESPITLFCCFSDFITLFSLFDGFLKVDFCDEIQTETDCGCTPAVNGGELFGGDFEVVEFLNNIFERKASDSFNGVFSNIFLSNYFLKHLEIVLNCLLSFIKFSFSGFLQSTRLSKTHGRFVLIY